MQAINFLYQKLISRSSLQSPDTGRQWHLDSLRALRITLLYLSAVGLSAQTFRGFDKNDYPGDQALPKLRKTFDWTGYWLSAPPGMSSNPWQGKRAELQNSGFGFALLYRSKTEAELKTGDAAQKGLEDAGAAVAAALWDGFAKPSLIFLDIEEGGRLLPEQKAYLFAWADAVTARGFRAGVYCSGIPVADGPGKTITTAGDIVASQGARKLAMWIANDACPPAPGCVAHAKIAPQQSGLSEAEIWQYAQSPRRPQFAGACTKTYATDSNCYAPGTQVYVDLNISKSQSPSRPKRHP
jgi:hypothetical protein